MGMSMHVVGLRDVTSIDGEFSKMLAAKQACDAAGVSHPQQLRDYFWRVCKHGSDESADRLTEAAREVSVKPREWSADMQEGYEVDLASLPEDCKTLRFCCSW